MISVEDFHAAVKSGNIATITAMINENPQLVDSQSVSDAKKQFPLHIAAQYGLPRVTELLLENGAFPDTKDARLGATPLGWAAFFGRAEVAGILLDKGADPSARNIHGVTPLTCALAGAEGKWLEASDADLEDWEDTAAIIRQHGGQL